MWRSYAGGHQQWLLLDHGRILLTVFRQAKWVENFWGRTPISPAMRFWAFHARSVPSALKRNTSCPDNFEHVRMILSSSQSKASCKKSLASLSQTFTNVVPSSLCTGNLALSVPVISASNSVAIASQKHCVIPTCRNLGVWHSFIQWWNIALITAFVSAGHSVSITPEKHIMTHACRNLGVCVKLLSELPPNKQRTWTGTKQVSALTQSTGTKTLIMVPGTRQ